MRIPSIVSRDAERDTYLVLDERRGQLGCAWRATDAESADRVTLIRDLLGHGSCVRKLTDSPLRTIRGMNGYGMRVPRKAPKLYLIYNTGERSEDDRR